MGSVVVAPTSKGSVTLKSASAWDYPLVDPNFLATASDRYIMSQGVLRPRYRVITPYILLIKEPDSYQKSPNHSSRQRAEGFHNLAIRCICRCDH